MKETNFEIGSKTGQNTGGVVVVDEFAAEFKVEFIKNFDALFDFGALESEVFFRVETVFHKPPDEKIIA